MAREQLGFQGLPRLAIAEGATTPDPGIVGVLVWSTTLGAVVRWNGTSWNAIGGGIANFTSARNTAAPNATIPVHSFAATGAETNIDAAFSPKGSGALSARAANDAASGGNKRGPFAVDLQLFSGVATQVASGNSSVIGGGQNNTASGAGTVVAGGSSNNASGSTASIGGGSANTASGNNSTVGGGNSNIASGAGSTISGGRFATTNGILGLWAYGFNGTAAGQNQLALFGGRSVTTGTTAVRATADGLAASTANQLVLRDNSAFKVRGEVVARDTVTGDTKEWDFHALIKRGAAAANTALVGTPTVTSAFADAAASAWAITIAADTTNGALAVNVQGAGGNAIRWTVVCRSVEVAQLL